MCFKDDVKFLEQLKEQVLANPPVISRNSPHEYLLACLARNVLNRITLETIMRGTTSSPKTYPAVIAIA